MNYLEWSESVQNTNKSSADILTNEIVTNCQNNICTADVHNQDREKDTEGFCFLSRHYIYYMKTFMISVNMLN